jgi:hypothetical protein
MRMSPSVSVVIPVFRNEDTLLELHRRLSMTLDPLPFEILFVDDASPDGSPALLERIAREDDRVGVVVLERNGGQQRAVLAGLRLAQGDRVVVMDADLQDPPEAVPGLLARLEEDGVAVVFAGRRGRYESLLRLLTSRVFKRLLHLLAGVPPDAGLFLAMDRRMTQGILALPMDPPFVVAMVGATGLPAVSTPVRRAARPSGRSAYRFGDRMAVGVGALFGSLALRLGPRRPRHPAERTRVARLFGARFGSS